METKNTPLISELISKYDTQDQSKQDRIDKAEGDFEFFCNTYLPHYFSCEPAAYHLVIYDIVNKSAVNQQDIERLKTHTRKMLSSRHVTFSFSFIHHIYSFMRKPMPLTKPDL